MSYAEDDGSIGYLALLIKCVYSYTHTHKKTSLLVPGVVFGIADSSRLYNKS